MATTSRESETVREESFTDSAEHFFQDLSGKFTRGVVNLAQEIKLVAKDLMHDMTSFSNDLASNILSFKQSMDDEVVECNSRVLIRSHIDSLLRPEKIEGIDHDLFLERKSFLSNYLGEMIKTEKKEFPKTMKDGMLSV